MSWFKKSKNHKQHPTENNKKACEYASVSECPYSDPEMCNFDKTNCLLAFELKNKKPKRNTTQALWIIDLASLLIYALVVLFSSMWNSN